MLALLNGIDPEDSAAQAKFAMLLDTFVCKLAKTYEEPPESADEARELVGAVLDFVGRDRLIAVHPAYAQGDWFDKVIEAASLHLHGSSEDAASWSDALDSYEGLQAVPLMTVHKSKGLEYHTVIFVGLDDDAWWSFDADQIEATAGFFVAFTRAKQRVIFTYCPGRGRRTKIATLYQLLEKAGVTIKQVA
jgi:superfamily I DNA/RNA helicase